MHMVRLLITISFENLILNNAFERLKTFYIKLITPHIFLSSKDELTIS